MIILKNMKAIRYQLITDNCDIIIKNIQVTFFKHCFIQCFAEKRMRKWPQLIFLKYVPLTIIFFFSLEL